MGISYKEGYIKLTSAPLLIKGVLRLLLLIAIISSFIAIGISPKPVYAAADVAIETSGYDLGGLLGTHAGVYWTSTTVGYFIFVDSSNDLKYRKTSDGGASWGAAVNIRTGTIIHYCTYADWETSGDSGTKIHIIYIDTNSDDVRYCYLDTSGDSVGGDIQVEACQGTHTMSETRSLRYNFSTITKTRGGNLAVAFKYRDDDSTLFECTYVSEDAGSSWGSIATAWEASENDFVLLFAANLADADDFWGLYWDGSANQLSMKTYDDSGDSWSETTFTNTNTFYENNNYTGYDGCVRLSDGHLIVAAHSNYPADAHNLCVWDATNEAVVTAKTNVLTGVNEAYCVSVFINQATGDIYVAYINGTDFTTEVACKYQKSADGGANWGGETAMQADAEDDERWVSTGAVKETLGGKFMPIWYNDDLDDYFCNTANAITIQANVPPVVSTSAATNIGTATAMLNMSLTTLNGASANLSFEYGTTTEYGSTANVTANPVTETGLYSANISGLSVGTTYHFRARADGEGGTGYGSDAQFDTLGGDLGWGQRLRLTIDASKVDEDLTNFPVLINLSSSSGWNSDNVSLVFTELGSNSHKIAVTTDDGITQCYVEISSWNSTTEKAVLWTKVPLVSHTTDTILYLYYDNAQADNDSYVGDTGSAVSQNVWSGFAGVWHLDEQGNGTLGEYKDSTSAGNDGHSANVNGNNPILSVDNVGIPCQLFGGLDDSEKDGIIIPDADELSPILSGFPQGFTFEMMLAPDTNNVGWTMTYPAHKMNPFDVSQVEYLHKLYDPTGRPDRAGWTCGYYHTANYVGSDGQAASDYRNNYTVDVMFHSAFKVTFTSVSTGNYLQTLRDGVMSGAQESTFNYAPKEFVNSTADLRLGYWDSAHAYNWYSGRMREIRISQTNRSAAWLKSTSYSNRDLLISFVPEDIESPVAPTVTTLPASSVTSQTATLSGNLTDMGSASSVIVSFEWGESVSYGHYMIAYESPLTDNGTFTANITGLSANTTYHARAKAIGDEISYGGDINFLTDPAVAPTVVTMTTANITRTRQLRYHRFRCRCKRSATGYHNLLPYVCHKWRRNGVRF